MVSTAWTEQDLEQVSSLGIDPAQVDRQIALFKNPPPFIHLARPAVLGDGIFRLSEEEISLSLKKYEVAKDQGRFLKFVPASGAATRMFQTLFKFLGMEGFNRPKLEAQIKQGDRDSIQMLQFMEQLPKLAFYSELKEAMEAKGVSLEAALKQGDYGTILRYLLSTEGLDYAQKPKGLIYFHNYGTEQRTSFEEQLVEGEQSSAGIHFTVSAEHLEKFKEHYKSLTTRRSGHLAVDFSVQDPSSQTIAVTQTNQPFRNEKGRLVFRPAGHGALIDNLNRLNADLVFIKNIDNVAVHAVLKTSIHWKKVLGGYLVLLQEKAFGYLRSLHKGPVNNELVEQAVIFCRTRLLIDLGNEFEALELGKKASLLQKLLDRPIRVCGVVLNTGEPGGGPFWVLAPTGKISLQIVESAQININDQEQKGIFGRSTHFNPVDLVCGVRDWQGKPFPLRQYVDDSAIFMSEKSVNGEKIKALELPGLWNGAMADWITLFVEVPNETFNPVKTVFDLLKPAHQV